MESVIAAGRQLAGAWMSNNDQDFFDLVEEAMISESRDGIFLAASSVLPPEVRLDFIDDLFSAAGEVGVEVLDEKTGKQRSANVRLFAFAVNAKPSSIESLMSDEGKQVVASSLKAAGMIHDETQVVFAPVALGLDEVASVPPWRYRTFAENLALRLFESAEDSGDEAFRIGETPTEKPENSGSWVRRILIGARVTYLDDETSDFVDEHPLEALRGSTIFEFEGWVKNRTAARERFSTILQTAMRLRSAPMNVSRVGGWSEAVDEMCLLEIQSRLASDSALTGGVRDPGNIDFHYHISDNDFWIVSESGGIPSGPVILSGRIVHLGKRAIVRWMERRGRSITVHRDAQSLLATFSKQRH